MRRTWNKTEWKKRVGGINYVWTVRAAEDGNQLSAFMHLGSGYHKKTGQD